MEEVAPLKFLGFPLESSEARSDFILYKCLRLPDQSNALQIIRRLDSKCDEHEIYFSTQHTRKHIIFRIPFINKLAVERLYEEAKKEHYALRAFEGLGT